MPPTTTRVPPRVPTLADRFHLEGCPSQRIEKYPAVKPRRVTDDDGNVVVGHRTVTVVRCVDCGGEQVVDPTKPAKAEPDTEGVA